MTSLLFSLLAVAPSLVERPSDSLRMNEGVTIERSKEKKIYNDGRNDEGVLNKKSSTVKSLRLPSNSLRINKGKDESVFNEKSPTVKRSSFPFSMRSWSDVTEAAIEVTIPFRTERLGFTVREKTEIKVGDIIRAVVKNPKTGRNISESNEVEVQY